MKYNLVIVGGGTAGCAAAYIAAKNGLKTLLIEKNSFLGGSITGSLVTPAMKTNNSQINNEFYSEFLKCLNSLGGQVTYLDGNEGWLNPELVKIILDNMLSEAGVDVLFNTYVTNLNIKNREVVSLNLSCTPVISTNILSLPIETTEQDNDHMLSKELSVYIETDYIIDATASQDICKKLNCRFINDNGSKQPSSIRFIASNVNLKEFLSYILDLDKDRNATSGGVIDGQIHLSTACTWDKDWALTPLFKAAVASGTLKNTDTSYFQIFTIPGMPDAVAFNCPRFPEIAEYSDLFKNSQLIIETRKAILRLMEFCKANFPGFKDAYISSIAPLVGVRTSERALGKYIYTIEDLKSGKEFKNPVLLSDYPVDVHSDKKEGAKLEKVMKQYQLPIESLISADYDNLYFAGRSVSCDFYSQAALRIIPSCFSMGEGLAKYLANLSNL